jgi:peptidyl-prolyl cis-trans isomerase SurA
MHCIHRRGFALTFLAATVLLPASAAPRVVDRVAALVNDEVVLLSEVDQICKAALDEVPSTLPLDEAVERKREIRKAALDTLIDDLLIKQQVREHKVSVSEEEVQKQIGQLMKDNNLNEKQFEEALMLEGKTIEDLKRDISRQMERSKLIDLQMRTNPELRSQIQVREKEIEDYYQLHYSTMERVRASHILFILPPGSGAEKEKEVRARAQKVLDQLRQGAPFDLMAKQHSDDPSSALGGDLGWFRRGDMVESFEKVAFGLKKGQLSDLVKTKFGIHIILLTDHSTEGPPDMAKVQDEIRSRLHREKFQRAMQGWLDELRRHSFIDYKL